MNDQRQTSAEIDATPVSDDRDTKIIALGSLIEVLESVLRQAIVAVELARKAGLIGEHNKNNPGYFEAYGKAEPDEPTFTLLARDPQAAYLVSIWSKLRAGDKEAATRVFESLLASLPDYPRPDSNDMDKCMEAMDCSIGMFRWRGLNRPSQHR